MDLALWIAVGAALVAVLLSSFELFSTSIGAALRALPFYLMRLGADGLVGLGAYAPVHRLAPHWPAVAVSITAGAAGTTALRSYTFAVGKGSRRQVGLVAPYEALRKFTDEKIASAVATSRVDWLRGEVGPALRNLDMDSLLSDVMSYLDFRGDLSQAQLGKLKSTFESILAAGPNNSEVRIEFFKALISAGGIVQLRSTVRRCNNAGSGSPATSRDSPQAPKRAFARLRRGRENA